jgi:hypothetical protein
VAYVRSVLPVLKQQLSQIHIALPEITAITLPIHMLTALKIAMQIQIVKHGKLAILPLMENVSANLALKKIRNVS